MRGNVDRGVVAGWLLGMERRLWLYIIMIIIRPFYKYEFMNIYSQLNRVVIESPTSPSFTPQESQPPCLPARPIPLWQETSGSAVLRKRKFNFSEAPYTHSPWLAGGRQREERKLIAVIYCRYCRKLCGSRSQHEHNHVRKPA